MKWPPMSSFIKYSNKTLKKKYMPPIFQDLYDGLGPQGLSVYEQNKLRV